MPGKRKGMTPDEQEAMFKSVAQKMIDDGLLSPTEAEAALDKTLKRGVTLRRPPTKQD